MIWKVVGIVLSLLIILFSIGIVYQNIPSDPVKLSGGEVKNEEFSVISYRGTPVFLENLRFNHNDITYSIDDSCSDVRRDAMVEAFGLFEWMMEYIRFRETNGEADIDIGCSNDFVMLGEGLFAAGEGGPVRIVNTSRFKVIEKGRIFLYDDPRCDYPIVELHELGHVFGFDHSGDPSNIMYNISRCDQRVTADMIELIDALYAIEPLADVWISNLSATKRGRYLDFNLTVLNEGLLDADGVDLSIVVGRDVVETLDIGEIEIGFGRTLRVENLKLPSGFDSVDFYIDRENSIEEFDERNNFVRMVVDGS
jgi:hypothetical protein